MKELKPDAALVRRLGLGKAVDTITDRENGFCTPLYWNKDDSKFGVHLSDETFQNLDVKLVRAHAVAAMKALSDLKWVPVILVMDLTDPSSYSYSGKMLNQKQLTFHFDRFEVAEMPDGSVRALEWKAPKDSRMLKCFRPYSWEDGKKPSDLPFSSKSGKQFYFPYTEEMWTGVEALGAGIDELRKKIRQLLRQPDAQQVIGNAGAKMMKLLADAPAPPPGKEE